MKRYRVHSNNGDGKLTIRLIQNGIIVEYEHLTATKEKYFPSLEEMYKWLNDFYIEK